MQLLLMLELLRSVVKTGLYTFHAMYTIFMYTHLADKDRFIWEIWSSLH